MFRLYLSPIRTMSNDGTAKWVAKINKLNKLPHLHMLIETEFPLATNGTKRSFEYCFPIGGRKDDLPKYDINLEGLLFNLDFLIKASFDNKIALPRANTTLQTEQQRERLTLVGYTITDKKENGQVSQVKIFIRHLSFSTVFLLIALRPKRGCKLGLILLSQF